MANLSDERSPAQIDDWIRRAYQPHGNLETLLGSLAASLMNLWPLRSLALTVHDHGAWHAERREGRVHVEWRPPGADPQTDPMERAGDRNDGIDTRAPGETQSIHHAGVSRGALALVWQAGLPETSSTAPALRHLCAWLGRLCHRHRVEAWLRAGHRPIRRLIGTSPALTALECFIERASQSDLPVLLRGELGTDKTWTAAAVHVGSRRRSGPWVEVHCAHPLDGPAAWLQRAAGGTLFLNGIDELAPSLQAELLGHLLATQPSPVTSPAPTTGDCRSARDTSVRLMAATTADLRPRGSMVAVSPALHAELDYLFVELPSLRTRQGDIPLLMEAALDGRFPTDPPQVAGDLVAAFQTYAWPGNTAELDRAMACLATLSDRPVIGLEDLGRHAPWLLPTEDPLQAASLSVSLPEGVALPTSSPPVGTPVHELASTSGPLRPLALSTASGLTAAPRSAAQWVGIVLERQSRILDTLHPGMRRALLFLSDHFAEPVSLTDLAAQAHVSASHLTFLFRNSLGMSFKSFLLCLRIHVAQQLLKEPQLRITEVALRAGFADLSHFERCFRRAVGRSAREHRRAMSQTGAGTGEETA